jgi:hypothetical protein
MGHGRLRRLFVLIRVLKRVGVYRQAVDLKELRPKGLSPDHLSKDLVASLGTSPRQGAAVGSL